MTTYRFTISEVQYCNIDVNATAEDEAIAKVRSELREMNQGKEVGWSWYHNCKWGNAPHYGIERVEKINI